MLRRGVRREGEKMREKEKERRRVETKGRGKEDTLRDSRTEEGKGTETKRMKLLDKSLEGGKREREKENRDKEENNKRE